MTEGPPARKAPGLRSSPDEPDLTGEWADGDLEGPTALPDPEPARQYLTFALLGLVAIVVLTLLALVGARRISVGDATQLGGIVLTPLFTLLGLAAAYYFRHGGS